LEGQVTRFASQDRNQEKRPDVKRIYSTAMWFRGELDGECIVFDEFDEEVRPILVFTFSKNDLKDFEERETRYDDRTIALLEKACRERPDWSVPDLFTENP